MAIVHKIGAIKELLETVKNKTCPYHFIEVMNCEGGCIGGGGQPKISEGQDKEVKAKRMEGLYQKDQQDKIRACYENDDIKKIYDEFLLYPGSEIALNYLHVEEDEKNDI